MRNQKAIEKDIDQLRNQQVRLQYELGQFESQEKAALAKLGEELLSGATGSTDDLANLRVRKDGVAQAFELVKKKLALTEQEFRDLHLAEAVTPYQLFVESFWPRLARLQAQLGAAGLNGEIEALGAELRAAVQMYTGGGGQPPDMASTIERGLTNISRNLLETWQATESLQAYAPDNQRRQPAEFGKLP